MKRWSSCSASSDATPKFNKKAGRDHWPHCFSVLLAGGGVQGGAVIGASDRIAAYPKAGAVTPEDLVATIHHALGVAPATIIRDPLDRPMKLSEGSPITRLF